MNVNIFRFLILLIYIATLLGCSDKKSADKTHVENPKNDEKSKLTPQQLEIKNSLERKKKSLKNKLIGRKWVLKIVTQKPKSKNHAFRFPEDSLYVREILNSTNSFLFLNDSICIVDQNDTIKYRYDPPVLLFEKHIVCSYPYFTKLFEVSLLNEYRFKMTSLIFDGGQNEIGKIDYLFYKE